jgi:hypothetical protein
MFIEQRAFPFPFANSEMPSISLFAKMIRSSRIAINISPLGGEDLPDRSE